MSSTESDLEKKIKGLNLNEKADINILLLGETGVGKSTFINSIANYLTYTNLKRAEKEDLLALIPSKCQVKDKHGDYHIFQIGSEKDQNEYLDTGVSATQDVKTYIFPIWSGKTKIRLIDTPGMGDTRGIEQDNINCDNILNYIGQLHELHAICFLFKPTNARITTFFKYCMDQILSRLDKSASKNIIFIFTNTRGTDYNAGDTLPILKEVIRDIKASPPNVDIPLNRNIFCFDNEAFKYLAAIKHGIDFDNAVKLRNKESWEKSAGQCWGLIKYIVGDVKNSPLKPHFIKSTSAINEARRLITQLSQPLAEIAQLINDNLFVLQRQQEHLNVDTNSLEELKKKLYMPVINLKVTTLTQPVTVCASNKCAEVYKVGDNNKWHYKQRCHDPCYLKNVPKDFIGTPELVHCAAMDSSKNCVKCGCDFSAHMHIYYMTKTKEDRTVDPNVQTNINNKERVLQNVSQLIRNILDRKRELEKEHDIIVKCCARFALFLQNNAITPFNDSYKDYIEYLIIREKSLGVLCNMPAVHHLQKILREYEEAKKSFDEALKLQKKLGESDVYITPQKIQDSIQELYKLKHNGTKIKELYECQKKSRSKEHEFTEYVHKVVSKQPKVDADNSEKKDDKKKDKKENDFQKKPGPKNNQFKKGNIKTENQPRNDRSKSQQRGRPRTPPPSYQDASGRNAPSRPYYAPPAHGQYHPTPDSYSGYFRPAPGSSPYPPEQGPAPYLPAQGPTSYPAAQSPAPYPPAQGPAPYPPAQGPAPYFYPPRHNDKDSNYRRKDEKMSYEVKIVVDNPERSQSSPRDYPQRDAYPPRDPYYSEPHSSHLPRESYPAYGADKYRYPYYQPSTHGAPPPGGYPHHYGHTPYGYPVQGASSQPSGTAQYREDNQRRPQRNNDNDNSGRRGGYRSGRGRGAINKNQKFKQGYRKKKNEGNNKESDEDSDSSVASSKK